jgi:hypothetical protein
MRAGLHRTAVGQLERGERVGPAPTRWSKLACALEASPLEEIYELRVACESAAAELAGGAPDRLPTWRSPTRLATVRSAKRSRTPVPRCSGRSTRSASSSSSPYPRCNDR